MWYSGVIKSYDKRTHKYEILYDDDGMTEFARFARKDMRISVDKPSRALQRRRPKRRLVDESSTASVRRSGEAGAAGTGEGNAQGEETPALPPPPPPPKPCSCSQCRYMRMREKDQAGEATQSPRPPEDDKGEGDEESAFASANLDLEQSARCRERCVKSASKRPTTARETRGGEKKSAEYLKDRSTRSDRRALAFTNVVEEALPEAKRLKFARSSIHAWGVVAEQEISAGDFVIEYRGELIGNALVEKRAAQYEREGLTDYMFRVDLESTCDATHMGSLARYINHSCDPNCETKIVIHQRQKKIALYAKRDIALGEELAYDYKFPIEEVKIPCHCGVATCREFLN